MVSSNREHYWGTLKQAQHLMPEMLTERFGEIWRIGEGKKANKISLWRHRSFVVEEVALARNV